MKKKISLPAWFYLFTANMLVLCFGFAFYIFISLGVLQKAAVYQTEQNLRTFAISLENLIKSMPNLVFFVSTEKTPPSFTNLSEGISFDAFLKLLAQKNSGFRISMIALDGSVLADSDENPADMENHKNRIEIKLASSGIEGTAVRISSVNKQKFIYYAKPLYHGGEQFIFRLATPVSSTVFYSSSMRTDSIISAIAILASILAVSFALTRAILKPLNFLNEAAVKYQEGDFTYRPKISASVEFAELGEKMVNMAKTIQKNFYSISAQKEENEALFLHSQEALIVFDSSMTVLKCNTAAEKLLGAEPNKSAGQPLIGLVRNTDIINYLGSIVETGFIKPEEIEASITPCIGTEPLYLLVRCSIARAGISQNNSYLAAFTDITKLKKLERIRKDFVANVSHELKTPITSIRGFIETLQDGSVDAKTRKHFLTIMQQQTIRMENIINDLLTISRLEQNQDKLKTKSIALADILISLQGLYRDQAIDKKITLEFFIDSETLAVNGNANLLEQAVGNLVHNALAYCTEGAVVSVSIAKENTAALIAVEDTGPGIPEKERERIFERFYRIDRGRSRETGGTGLGLSIARHIVLIHGGSIFAERRLDNKQGARFVIRLPLASKTD